LTGSAFAKQDEQTGKEVLQFHLSGLPERTETKVLYLCSMFGIRRYISIALFICFIPVITPKEFIHDLMGHNDTDCLWHPDKTVNKAHQHCKILQITASAFVAELKIFSIQTFHQKSIYFFSSHSFISGISFHISNLRAPPVNTI
jgi:hypothetical protein